MTPEHRATWEDFSMEYTITVVHNVPSKEKAFAVYLMGREWHVKIPIKYIGNNLPRTLRQVMDAITRFEAESDPPIDTMRKARMIQKGITEQDIAETDFKT